MLHLYYLWCLLGSIPAIRALETVEDAGSSMPFNTISEEGLTEMHPSVSCFGSKIGGPLDKRSRYNGHYLPI